MNNSFALLEAALLQQGIALLPAYLVADALAAGVLQQISLADVTIPPTPFYIAYETSTITRTWARMLHKALS